MFETHSDIDHRIRKEIRANNRFRGDGIVSSAFIIPILFPIVYLALGWLSETGELVYIGEFKPWGLVEGQAYLLAVYLIIGFVAMSRRK